MESIRFFLFRGPVFGFLRGFFFPMVIFNWWHGFLGGNRKLPRAEPFENFSKSESWKSHSPSCLQDIKNPNWVVGENFKSFLFFNPNFGEDEPILTSIFFQMVWNFNHQLTKFNGWFTWIHAVVKPSSEISFSNFQGLNISGSNDFQLWGGGVGAYYFLLWPDHLKGKPTGCRFFPRHFCWILWVPSAFTCPKGPGSGWSNGELVRINGLVISPIYFSGGWIARWWQLKRFLFSPLLWGKWSNLTNIFEMRWNHQQDWRNITHLSLHLWSVHFQKNIQVGGGATDPYLIRNTVRGVHQQCAVFFVVMVTSNLEQRRTTPLFFW